VVTLDTLFAMKAKDSGFRIRVERELRDEFVAACRDEDRPAAQVLREFMRDYVSRRNLSSDAAKPENNRKG
jgi:hypothetical protein